MFFPEFFQNRMTGSPFFCHLLHPPFLSLLKLPFQKIKRPLPDILKIYRMYPLFYVFPSRIPPVIGSTVQRNTVGSLLPVCILIYTHHPVCSPPYFDTDFHIPVYSEILKSCHASVLHICNILSCSAIPFCFLCKIRVTFIPLFWPLTVVTTGSLPGP